MKNNLVLHKIIRDMPIELYHSTPDTFSSSQFKDLLDDEDIFIKKHIQKTVEKEENGAFDIGTYFHTGILEPHKLKTDCVVFPGKIRRGDAWEKFKTTNRNKTIVTQTQKDQAQGIIKAVKNSPVAQQYLKGESEVSLFTLFSVFQGQIFAPYFGKVLTLDGWEPGPKKKQEGAYNFTVKTRADLFGESFISDLKSTTGNARSNKSMRDKISYYHYDLSASLYLDTFSLINPDIQDFIWIFASKDIYNSMSYRASITNLKVGRAKYMKAMIKMADCARNKWQSVDYLGVLEPNIYELEHLKEKDSDLL